MNKISFFFFVSVLRMLSSTLSTPATASLINRDRSHQNNNLRSKSQPPPVESRFSFISPSTPPATVHPMKNFFGNLLNITPHRYVSSFTNRSKISSSLSIPSPSDRSSRLKPAHPSVVSSLSIRSGNALSPYETRVNVSFSLCYFLFIFFFYFSLKQLD